MRYNKALDLLCLAAALHQEGQTVKAAKAFVLATKQPSLADALRVVEATNKKATAEAKRTVKSATQLKAAAWPFAASAVRSSSKFANRIRAMDGMAPMEPNPGEELRVEPEENGDREVQEAFGDDDLMFLDESDDIDLLTAEADEGEGDDEGEGEGEGEEEDEGDDEGEKEESTAVSASRFARFVRNQEALRSIAAKKAKKKPARKK